MDFFLKDKVAIVTGAASGMGRAVATMLAAEGVRVGRSRRRGAGGSRSSASGHRNRRSTPAPSSRSS